MRGSQGRLIFRPEACKLQRMAGLIPRAFIDDLLARIDIVDVIDSRVPLKKSGANYKACCPFHSEQTPSFTVSQSKQFYHCFGCGAHGTAISFLMEYERLSFPDAVEELAHSQGIEIPREETQQAARQRHPGGEHVLAGTGETDLTRLLVVKQCSRCTGRANQVVSQ